MRTVFILFLILFFMTRTEKNIPDSSVDTEFDYYIELFEHVHNRKVTTPVRFSKMQNTAAGVCTKYLNGYKIVEINIEMWLSYSEEQREILIFHELGHCELNRTHNEESFGGCPVSIMRSHIPSLKTIQRCYIKNRMSYLENL